MAEPAKKSFWDNLSEDAKRLYGGMYEAATHPARTTGDILEAIGNVTNAVAPPGTSAGMPAVASLVAPERKTRGLAASQEAGRRTMGNVVSRYGEIARDPAGSFYRQPITTAMDVGALLDPAAAMARGRFPGAARALEKASQIASSPVAVPARVAAKAASTVARPLARSARARTSALAGFHPTVATHPSVAEEFEKVVPKKGASEATAREAVLRAAGASADEAPILRSSTTKERPASPASGSIASGVKAANKAGVQAKLAAKAPEVAPDAVGSEFIKSYLNGRKAVEGAFRNAYSNEGVVAPRAIEGLGGEIEKQLVSDESAGLPNRLKDLKTFYESYPEANNLLFGKPNSSGIIDRMKAMAEERTGLSLPEIEQFRKLIGTAWKKANSNDRAAVSAIRDAFDNWAEGSVKNPDMFIGDSAGALEDFATARKTFGDFKKTFEDSPNPNIKAATGKIIPHIEEGELSKAAPSALPEDISNTLLKGAYDPKTMGPKDSGVTYQTLTADPTETGIVALSPEGVQALNETIRSKVYGSPVKSQHVDPLINGPYGHLFKPDEADIRLSGAAHDILDAAPEAKSSLDKGSQWGKRVGAGLLGHAVGESLKTPLSGIPLIGDTLGNVADEAGFAAGAMLESKLERRGADKAIKAEMEGAPVARAKVEPGPIQTGINQARILAEASKPEEEKKREQGAAPAVGEAVDPAKLFSGKAAPTGTPTAPPTGEAVDPASLFQERAPRASGGATSARKHVNPLTAQRLMKRLLGHVERARKEAKRETSQILHHDDASVAKALAIAGSKI